MMLRYDYPTVKENVRFGCRKMEKKKPTHNLARFKEVTAENKIRMTVSATDSASELGYTRENIIETIQLMERKHFYKSMPSYHDSKQWQDVYHVPATDELIVYIKFTDDTVCEFKLLSFKEK